jgi:hypothetical protein
MDKAHDGHGVANQLAKLEHKAREHGWMVVYRLSDNDIPRFDKAGVRFAEVDGNIDLGTDSGRLAARILIAVAKAAQERKAERQKLADEQAAMNGKRFLGGPRPFGYGDDHVTAHPVEGSAVAEACAALLGGGSITGSCGSGPRWSWLRRSRAGAARLGGTGPASGGSC